MRGVLHNDTQVLSLVRRWRTTCNKEWMAASVFWVNNDGTPSPVHFWFRAFPVPDWLELSARQPPRKPFSRNGFSLLVIG